MKFSISKHESHLTNAKASLAQEEARLAKMTMTVQRLRDQVEQYEQQIVEAKRRKLDGFDSDRFMKGRKGATWT